MVNADDEDETRRTNLSPVWPNVQLWVKNAATATCFCAHVAIIAGSVDPVTDPFVLLVSLSVALNSFFLFAFGLPLLFVDVFPHRFPAVAKHKIQPAFNSPLPRDLIWSLLTGGTAPFCTR